MTMGATVPITGRASTPNEIASRNEAAEIGSPALIPSRMRPEASGSPDAHQVIQRESAPGGRERAFSLWNVCWSSRYRARQWRAVRLETFANPALTSLLQPGPAPAVCEVSNRSPAITMNAWPPSA